MQGSAPASAKPALAGDPIERPIRLRSEQALLRPMLSMVVWLGCFYGCDYSFSGDAGLL